MRGVSGDVLKAERGVVFRGCRLVTGGPGRHGNRSPDTRTRPRGASLHALRRIMPKPEARTRRPKITTVERREARRPDRKGRQGASQAPGVPQHARGASQAPRAVSALRSPSLGKGKWDTRRPRANDQRAGEALARAV